MSFNFLDRRSAERFAELLDETTGGLRHHHGGTAASGAGSSGRHDESGSSGTADEELAEFVAIGRSLSAARSGVQVDREFRDGLRAMLVATAERDGIGATAQRTETEPGGGHAAAREPKRSLLGRGTGRRIRARGAIIIGVAAGALAVSGISAASENATPGDALYGVKRQTERAQLAMAGSDVTRGRLALDFARTRLTEAAALGGTGDLTSVLDDMDADTKQGVKLLTGSAVAHQDSSPLTTIDGFVTGQRQTFTPMLAGLTPANRERVGESVALLQDVQQRTENLRAGLACDRPASAGADALGPKLRDCMTGTDDSQPAEQQIQGQGEKADTKPASGNDDEPKPKRTGPSVSPDAAVPNGENPAQPAEQPATGDPATGTPAPAEPGSTEDEDLIGGLLDGIFQ